MRAGRVLQELLASCWASLDQRLVRRVLGAIEAMVDARQVVLMELARQMSEVDSDDSTLYMERWLDFQTYWAQVLPMVPMYSNIYFDFTIPELDFDAFADSSGQVLTYGLSE